MDCSLSRVRSKLTRTPRPSRSCLRRAIGASVGRPRIGRRPTPPQRCAAKTVAVARAQGPALNHDGQLYRIFCKVVAGAVARLRAKFRPVCDPAAPADDSG